ncbi:MAG: glucose-6-phosphate dehydrogenase assembly protein OpcA [Thermostichales cyanobacterium BF4_bins_65]
MEPAAILPLQSPKDVSIGEIQAELDKLWSTKGEHGAARASTFTLVVYEALDDRVLLPSPTVESIATQNPCRVIDLRERKSGGDDGVSAQVAAYCPIQRDKSSLVCCEYITLQAPESAFVRMCNTVASLLIPDLPTFLWWQGDLDLSSRLFQELVKLSNRIIVDSSGFVNPEEDLQEMDLLSSQGLHCGDLNWRRLAPWQELAAQAFDPIERRLALSQLEQVAIDYKVGNPCQAFMYLGWLASRLGWDPLTRQHTIEHDYPVDRFTFRDQEGRVVSAELGAVPLISESIVPGGLIGVRLLAPASQINPATVICSESTGCMRMEAKGVAQQSVTQQVSPTENQSLDSLLSYMLQRIQRDTLYEETLMMVKKMINAPQP